MSFKFNLESIANQALQEGDILKCTESYGACFTEGELYYIYERNGELFLEDNQGMSIVTSESKFILIAEGAPAQAVTTNDMVNAPKHYEVVDGVEAKDVIKTTLVALFGEDGWKAYCLGNVLKYRLRAGSKDDLEQDIAKAFKYKEFAHA